jgi:hypothetical protein
LMVSSNNCFTVDRSPRSPLMTIAEKYNRSQKFISRLLRPQRILLNGLPIFGMLSLHTLAFWHRVPLTR